MEFLPKISTYIFSISLMLSTFGMTEARNHISETNLLIVTTEDIAERSKKSSAPIHRPIVKTAINSNGNGREVPFFIDIQNEIAVNDEDETMF